ncbi:MAG: Myo-inositol catabolism IolB domain-containing protein [Candidatus Uhrbacteria bacterium GW2011_GWF2_39_13]|uniref:Myo-inositol catabolism IolB domain-containing protein n=1 Tax=Candidatus Uhrbacteria bacterium GW2011_GWF2_39_13 TaxID=1618995 RepID=A0A0G0QSY8_9BACT|nr:MAG: Myo-inositol catabolism IolB domain-containing protein [Candidatus Uhrbacteria bacterium GW2011_GWF2_39_13]
MIYLKHYNKKNGFAKISNIGDADIQLTEFGIINLQKDKEYSSDTGKFETALIVLGGNCEIYGKKFKFSITDGRKNVFYGKPYTVYIPAGMTYTIKAATDLEIAWTASPSTLKSEPYMISPSQVKEVHIGKENYQRDAYLILTDELPAEHLFIGEAFVPSGNHASYPPHRHDFDNLPLEVDMEEIYFFRFNPEQGYGIQKIYTDDKSIDVTCTVKQNDTTLIPRGYHPVINAPGYTMYYLWIMAGQNHRKFLSVIDPEHKWIAAK